MTRIQFGKKNMHKQLPTAHPLSELVLKHTRRQVASKALVAIYSHIQILTSTIRVFNGKLPSSAVPLLSMRFRLQNDRMRFYET